MKLFELTCANPPVAAASPSPSPSVFPGFGQCRVTLAEFCGAAGCPDYATVVARMQRDCVTAPRPYEARAGHCPGVFYYTISIGQLSGGTGYYDGDGKMIGGSRGADYNAYCNGASFDIQGGVIPACPTRLELDQLCKR